MPTVNVGRVSSTVIEVMKRNFQENGNLGWQYFGSEEGVHIFYPGKNASGNNACDEYDPRQR